MPRAIQNSFAAGELSPSLHQRSDLDKFKIGLATCKNFIVEPHGPVTNRPGTIFVRETKDSSRRSRLVAFTFSTVQTYVLEFGHLYIRVFKDGAIVVYPAGHALAGQVVEIGSPYPEGMISRLKFVQSADVLTICHPDVDPHELTRTDHHAWTIAGVVIGSAMQPPASLSLAYYGASGGSYTYSYAVSAVSSGGDESANTAQATLKRQQPTGTGSYYTLTFPRVDGASTYNVYRRDDWKPAAKWSFLATVEDPGFGATATYSDQATATPNPAIGLPTNRNPFAGDGNRPSVVSYFQQRRIYAAPSNHPQTIYGSVTGSYSSFNTSYPLTESDAIEFTLVSREVNEIRALVPLKDLLVMTSGGEWLATGGTDGAISSTNIDLRAQGFRGCSHVPPITIGNTILFVQDIGQRVRDIAYSFESDGYNGNDLSILSHHLFDGRSIAEWAYAQHPYSVVWVVRDDGTLLSLTYVREHQVFAWSRHETDGVVESVACVQEGTESAVYLIVRRRLGGTWKRAVERMASRAFASIEDAHFADCGLVLDSPVAITSVTTASPAVITAAGHGLAEGDPVDITDCVGLVDINGRRCLATSVSGDSFSLLDEVTGDPVSTAGSLPYEGGGVARKAFATITGLDHLDGRTVSIVANGSVEAPREVAAGSITLPRAASRVHVGIPYECEIETLDVGASTETALLRRRRVPRLAVRVLDSRGFWSGPDAEHLTEAKWRATEAYDEPTRLLTGEVELGIDGKWSRGGRVLIRQRDPLPLTVTAIVHDVELGDE